jgi:aminopeptidase N
VSAGAPSPDGGLTQAEAAARANLLTVERYDVHLDLIGLAQGKTFRSRSAVSFSCSSPGASTWIDLAASEVHLVQLNGVRLPAPEVAQGERVRLDGLKPHNELLIEASHSDTASGVGLSRSVDTTDSSVYAWTNFEPFDAHRAFACFDQPDLKAHYRFSASVPAGWTCLSNSQVASVEKGPQSHLWKFAETPPLSTYVTALCAGPFHSLTVAHGETVLGLHARRSLAQYLEANADELFDLTRRGLDFFGERFAIPFPSNTYHHVFLPDLGGAMENFGCVTWSDRAIFRSAPTRAQAQWRAVVLLHEMAHMWFGDLVTMRWWDGLWLNESFADWAAYWATASATPYVNAWCDFAAIQKRRAYAADQSPTTHPIHREVPDVASAEAAFDAITYSKGASVLRQLVAWVGEERFLEGLRKYFNRFAWANSDLEGLLDELSAASGRDLRAWSREWLLSAGVNTLSLKVSALGDRYERVAALQRAPVEHPVLRSHRVAVGVYQGESGGDRLARRDRIEIDVGGERTEIAELGDRPRADLLLLNDDDLTFAKVRLDDDSCVALLERGQALPLPLSRMVALQIVWDMLVDGELAAAAVVAFAVRGIATETEETNVSTLIVTAVEAIQRYAPRDQVERLQAMVADAALAAVAEAEPGSSRWVTLQAGLAATATSEDQLRALEALLSGGPGAPDGDQGVRWRALTRLVALGRVDDDAVRSEERRDPDPDAGFRALGARAARGSRESKDRAFQALFAEPPSPPAAVGAIGASFWQPHQDSLLQSYARDFVDRLPALEQALGWLPVRRLLMLAFPEAGIDEDFLARVEALGSDPKTVPAVAAILRDRSADQRRWLHARRLWV